IAVSDNEDSENGYSELMPFKNIFNEWYARDTSKKVKTVLRNKGLNGGMLCTKPIYGYKRDPENKNHWLVDDEAAEVVRLIYDLCTVENLGTTRIVHALGEREVINPTEYFRRKGLSSGRHSRKGIFSWDLNTVRLILRNQAYLGDVVNFKTYKKSYKDHRTYWNAPENLVIFKGVNEPIISEEQYYRAQEILDKKRRIPTVRPPDLFQGYVYCADCGKRMGLNRAENHKGVGAYICGTYRRNTSWCTSHYTRREAVYSVTLREIRRFLQAAKADPGKFQKELTAGFNSNAQKDLKKAESEMRKLQQRNTELNKVISQLYEDRVLNRISEERYFSMVTDFENQQKEICGQIEENKKLLNSAKENTTAIDNFIKAVSKYDDVEELDQYVLLDLVDKIIIRQRTDGQDYEDTIDIWFKEIGHIFFEI
ncbi:MAG: recombinase family protein, partial [Ruminococcus sp.]|nr:recombinase family protein [Ruminococcus sp.]